MKLRSNRIGQVLGRSILLVDLLGGGADHQQLAALGDVRNTSIADLFVAVIEGQGGATP